jgi:hypothetical protein
MGTSGGRMDKGRAGNRYACKEGNNAWRALAEPARKSPRLAFIGCFRDFG